MKIISFVIQETGTYNNIYARPYVTKVDNHVLSTISNKLESGIGISPDMFSGIGSTLLAPSTMATTIATIPNGWNEKRLSFLLVATNDNKISGEIITYVQGYTDYVGVTNTGAIDPNMRFYINSMTTVVRNVVHTVHGSREIDRLLETTQILNGVMYTDIGYGPKEVYGLRPSDILNTNQVIGMYSTPGLDIRDSRVRMNDRSMFKSKRLNSVPTAYLSDIASAYSTAIDLHELGGGGGIVDTSKRAADILSNSDSSNSNRFARELEMVNGGITPTSFTTGDLEALDYGVAGVTNIVRIGDTRAMGLHETGSTEGWHGSNMEVILATVLSNSVPALMMSSMITKLHFRSTNHDAFGNINTVFIDVKSLLNMDLSSILDSFKYRLEREILFDLSQGGQIPYTLEMDCSALGESRISISIYGNPAIPYVTPSFCDSLYAPTITDSKEAVYQVTSDMTHILKAVEDYATSGKGSGVSTETFFDQQMYA